MAGRVRETSRAMMMRISRRWWVSAGLTAALVWVGASAAAQGPDGAPGSAKPLVNLLELPHSQVPIRYSLGSLDRAARLQGRLVDLVKRIDAWSKTRTHLTLLVVSPEDWEALRPGKPYGFPEWIDASTCAVPAWGSDESVALWRGLEGNRTVSAQDFFTRGSKRENASIALADLLLELDVCRTFARGQNLAGGKDGIWVNDLIGHLVCATHDHLRTYQEPIGLAALLGALAIAEGSSGGRPALEAYGADLDLATWLGYQAHFARGAEQLWDDGRKSSVKKILRLRRRKGGPLLFEDLLKAYPFLQGWRSGGA